MPLCCHSPVESSTYCHWITTELVNPSPLDYQSNATQSIKTLVKPILTQCISTHQFAANTVPLRLPRDNHSTNSSPIQYHLIATVLSLSRYNVTQTTNDKPFNQSIANPVPLDHHSTNTEWPLICHWTATCLIEP